MKSLTLDAKSFLASVALLALLGMAAGVMAVQGATTDVTATVTAELVAVSVSDGVVAYGVLSLDTATDTTASGINDSQTATNDGNVNADFGIRSSDAASGGTPWELAGAAASDAFTHEWCTSDCDGTPTWTDFDADNATYSSIATGVASNGTQAFDLRINTPTASTDSVEHTVTVTVQATAS